MTPRGAVKVRVDDTSRPLAVCGGPQFKKEEDTGEKESQAGSQLQGHPS